MKISDILVRFDHYPDDRPDSKMFNVIFNAHTYILRNYSDAEFPQIFEARYLKVFYQNIERLQNAEALPNVNPHLLYCLTYFLLDELRIIDDGDVISGPITEFLAWRVRLDGVHAQMLLQQELEIVKRTIDNAKILSNYDSVRSYIVENEKFDANLARIVELNAEANRLEQTMAKYRDAFNFAGLYNGFSQLRSRKVLEKNLRLVFLFCLGCLALLPLLMKLSVLYKAGVSEASAVEGWDQVKAMVGGNVEFLITLAALELLLLYFFRITLHSLKSLRAQLLQLDLRMTLCQFIDKYAEYSAQVKKGGGSLEGFESVVFSGLVMVDEKLPTTFDGLDVLQGLAEKLGRK